ncbi:MAG: 1-(5-phosphoribosyl)-5-amino-4-imidazole-carboxylate carboxylase [candidate division Zixibacteria bacterium RBG_16_53_22]|nr:MAG: 1-(5-phosphoribosyl)-5-amino-4-imidazole-carboxylate carboxylase [candidate division Zixibacteria bacterium RBG_16_53_22]
MKIPDIKNILEAVARGQMTADEGAKRLDGLPFEDLGFAKLDHHRSLRTGVPEVIFAPGKSDEQIVRIFGRMVKAGSDVLVTRVESPVYNKIRRKFKGAQYNKVARIIYLRKPGRNKKIGSLVAVVSAGTADMAVAEEAAVTAEAFGVKIERIYDVGVSGIHRLLAHRDKIQEAKVIIVVAGMEGALASVVGGLTPAPVIAVPTSVGYGASFQGLAALLAMLNSCAPGVTVVNIDNGFGAAVAAIKIVMSRES